MRRESSAIDARIRSEAPHNKRVQDRSPAGDLAKAQFPVIAASPGRNEAMTP